MGISNPDMEQLAEELGDLPYDSLADFLHLLGEKMLRASNTNMQNNHPELAGHLMACSKYLEQASSEVLHAWQTSYSHNHTTINNSRATTMNQNSRLQRTHIANDTLTIIQQGYYQANATDNIPIQPQLDTCVQNTRLYTPETLANLPNPTADYRIGEHTGIQTSLYHRRESVTHQPDSTPGHLLISIYDPGNLLFCIRH